MGNNRVQWVQKMGINSGYGDRTVTETQNTLNDELGAISIRPSALSRWEKHSGTTTVSAC